MSPLPRELLDEIFEYLCNDRQSLSTCSLVSRICMHASRRVLFRRIQVRNDVPHAEFLAKIHKLKMFLEGEPDLARVVQRLDLHTVGDKIKIIDPELLNLLLASVPQVHALVVTGGYLDSSLLTPTPRLCTKFKLKMLWIDACDYLRPNGFFDLIGILSMFSEIETLVIAGRKKPFFRLGYTDHKPTSIFSVPKLTRLSFIEEEADMIPVFVDYIFRANVPLRHLQLGAMSSVPIQIFDGIDVTKLHLTQIDICCCLFRAAAGGEEAWINGLAKVSICSVLQEVKLYTFLYATYHSMSGWWSELVDFVEALPQQLRRLSIIFQDWRSHITGEPATIPDLGDVFPRLDAALTKFAWAKPVTISLPMTKEQGMLQRSSGTRLQTMVLDDVGTKMVTGLPRLREANMLIVSYSNVQNLRDMVSGPLPLLTIFLRLSFGH